MTCLAVVKLKRPGVERVLNGQMGMTFIVDEFTDSVGGGRVAHVRDYRFLPDNQFQVWSIPEYGYEVLHEAGS